MNSPFATLSRGKERIKSAFSKKGSTKTDDEVLAERKEAFLSSHTLAEKRVADLRKTPGADRSDKVRGMVLAVGDLSTTVKQEGENATDVAAVDKACKRLSEIYEKANEATIACSGPNMEAFEKAREKARGRIGDMRQLPGATTFVPLQSRITAADDVYKTATRLAGEAVNASEVKTQIDALGMIAKLKLEAKQQSKKYLDAAPKNIAEFEKKRKSASDRLAEVRSLRGTTDDPETANRLQNADRILEDITTKARAAKTPELVTEQIKRLESIETLAKSVESLSKDTKQRARGDVKAIPKYNEMIIEAEKARDALMDIGVASEEYDALTKLVAASRMTLSTKGAGQALSDLSKYTDLVNKANKKQEDLKTKVSPAAVTTENNKLSPLLLQLEKLAPEYLFKMHVGEKDRLVLLGHTDETKAATALQALVDTVKDDLATVQEQKKDAEEKAGIFGTKKGALVQAGYKAAFFDVATQLGDLAAKIDVPARDWGRAVERLDKAIRLVGEVETVQKNAKSEWEKGDAERKKMRTLASQLLDWMPLATRANSLLESLNEIEQQFKATGDYAACQATYLSMNLDSEETALRDAMRDTPDMPDLKDLEALRREYTDADDELHPICADAETAFLQLERLMKGKMDPRGSELYGELQAVQDEWQEVMDSPKGGANPGTLVKPFVVRAKKVLADVNELLKDPQKLDEFGKKAREFDSRNPKGRTVAAVTEKINQLERSGLAMPKQRQTLKGLLQTNVTPEARGEGLLKLQEEIEGLFAANKRLETQRVAMTKEGVKIAVREPLKRAKGQNREFDGYQKILEDQTKDLEAMTDSDDPYFQRVARLETRTLGKKVAAVDPQQGNQGPRYKAVEERWDSLRKGLAGDMEKLMPNTHKLLHAELTGLIGKSRKLPPDEALKTFDNIEPRIQAAVDLLPKIKAEKDKYKVRKERLEKQWAQVKKETKTRVTDRVTDFADSFEIRLGEADAALKEENGFRRANTILKGLEDKLRTVETSTDPRAALQKMDAAVGQDQRAIRDLARAFEEELKYFKETTIPRARALIKERAAAQKSLAEKVGDKVKGAVSKFTETGVGGTDLDQELLTSLESTLKTAPRPVKTYLDMISTTTIGAAKSPELSTATAAFKSARGMLASATRTVEALKTTTGGADMTVTQDLKKVQANWIAQTQNYSKVARAMAAAIRDAAKDDPDDDVKTAANKASKTVTDAAAAFHATAFESEFKEMEKATATKEAKLAAREKVLTTMRAYRKLLLNHPVHKQLADPNNPFVKGSAMRDAARGILVGLKRIELETLVN